MQDCPKISLSFLKNINYGNNFHRAELTYPLHIYNENNPAISKFSEEEKEQVRIAIKNNDCSYEALSQKYQLTKTSLSLINTGKMWHSENHIYPLSKRSGRRGAWSKEAKQMLKNTKLSFAEIAQRVNKDEETISKLNYGLLNKNKKEKYPLRKKT